MPGTGNYAGLRGRLVLVIYKPAAIYIRTLEGTQISTSIYRQFCCVVRLQLCTSSNELAEEQGSENEVRFNDHLSIAGSDIATERSFQHLS